MADINSTDDAKVSIDIIFPKLFTKESHPISLPNTAKQVSNRICGNRLTFIGDGRTQPNFDLFHRGGSPPKFRLRRRRQSSVQKKKLSMSFLEPVETPNKKRKVQKDYFELDEDEEVEKAIDKQASHEEKEEDSEHLILVKEWIDPLLDMTMDSPRRITKKMLKLRMCIEKALKRDELTQDEEKMLNEAIERAKSDADDDEGILM